MESKPTPDAMKDFLLGHFQEELIGMLTSGIIHNINGPLQILSMQLEFFKKNFCEDIGYLQGLLHGHNTEEAGTVLKKLFERCGKGEERVEQMEQILARLHRMLDIIGRRSDRDLSGPRPLYLDQLLEEELEFFKADLFFKHSVKIDLSSLNQHFLVESRECEMRDVLDAILVTCIGQLRQGEDKTLRISVERNNRTGWKCVFKHSGPNSPDSPGEANSNETAGGMDFSALATYVAQEKALALGCDLEIQPDCIVLRCNTTRKTERA